MGCASKNEKAEILTTKHNTEDFKEAWKAGRAGKYLIDLGWEKMMQVFNVYGQSGGGKANEAIIETILAAVNQERDSEQYLPTLIVGDINADPKKLQNLVELVEEEGWIDVWAACGLVGKQTSRNNVRKQTRCKGIED